MGPRKPNRNHLLLVVSERAEELALTRQALASAGYEQDQFIAEDAHRAIEYLYARGDFEDSRFPSLLIIDLDHTDDEGRRHLAGVLEQVKSHSRYRLIPVLLLMRENDPAYIHQWYCMGVHACLHRPDDLPGMTALFESIRNYWSKHVILPEVEE